MTCVDFARHWRWLLRDEVAGLVRSGLPWELHSCVGSREPVLRSRGELPGGVLRSVPAPLDLRRALSGRRTEEQWTLAWTEQRPDGPVLVLAETGSGHEPDPLAAG